MVDFVICAKCGEREYASGEHVCPREPLTLDETEERLIKAWRRSGMSLGYLIARAMQRGDSSMIVGSRAMAITDRLFVEEVEAYARANGQKETPR